MKRHQACNAGGFGNLSAGLGGQVAAAFGIHFICFGKGGLWLPRLCTCPEGKGRGQ